MHEKRLKNTFRRGAVLVALSLFLGVIPISPAGAAGSTVYVVQSGDTLGGIAVLLGVSAADLAAANGLTLNDLIFTGQALAVPQPGDPTAAPQLATDPRVPYPMPSLPVLSQAVPVDDSELTYARVTRPNVAVYRHPALAYRNPVTAGMGAPIVRNLGSGYLWVSVEGEVDFRGQTWYEINPDEYVPADALWFYSPSTFQGVALSALPERPFGWALQTLQPRSEPAGPINPAAPAYGRYRLLQVFASQEAGGQTWYLIGPHQWVEGRNLGVVNPNPQPAGVPAGGAWVEVNLFEQTLAAYRGGQMVYATLISSGLDDFDTPDGLFSVWYRTERGKMSGLEGYSGYYYLEDVPWSLFFNRSYALHAAYWHNDFGYPHSHGCINLAPLDARWLYDWAPGALWVWVH